MTKIKQPKIRFKGHINGWEERKLKNVSTFKQGIQVDLERQYQIQNDNLIRFIRIVDYTQNTQDIRYIDINTSKNIIQPDDIIMVRYGATAGFIGRGIEGILANNMFSINPTQKIVKDYLYIYLRQDKIYKQLNNSNGSSAMPAINFSLVGNLNITYPKLEEQTKIGSFFKTLDDTIALHQQKLEVTKQFKQTMLKKMFPKNGETTPEIRFKGFTEDWEECKLGDFLYEVSKRGNSELEFITVREFDTILRPQSNQGYGNIVTDSKKLKAKIVLNGQFLIDLTSYSRGIYLSRLDGLTSNTYSVLELSEFGNLEFFTEFLKHPLFVSKLESLTPIGARQGKKIDQNSLLKSKFRIPHKEEQEVIGNYFKELDIQINSLEKKLFDMNLYKKTMLKKMFL